MRIIIKIIFLHYFQKEGFLRNDFVTIMRKCNTEA